MKDRIVQAINTQLQIRGLRQVSECADLVIGANVATEEKHTWETYYSGSGWGWGGGWATTTVETYEGGAFAAGLFDAGRKQMGWEGVGNRTLSDKTRKPTKEFRKVIYKKFYEFPPGH